MDKMFLKTTVTVHKNEMWLFKTKACCWH